MFRYSEEAWKTLSTKSAIKSANCNIKMRKNRKYKKVKTQDKKRQYNHMVTNAVTVKEAHFPKLGKTLRGM